MLKKTIIHWIACVILGITSLAFAQWNNPHNTDTHQKILYGAFAASPKTLDPAKSYSSDETQIIAQIYEPPLQYAYLKRPYQLEPLTLTQMPIITYLDKNNHVLPPDAPRNQIAYTVYTLLIKPGIYYQPHAAFSGKRELTAQDYVYQIKRLADPTINSPIYGVMSRYIVGFKEFSHAVEDAHKKNPFVDLRKIPLGGATVMNKYEYQIKIHGLYSQFLYWLAMPFFSPMPYEADLFYSDKNLKEKNMTLDWYPVGTGPYYLQENNPNRQMILQKNPNFHGELYPSQGESSDAKNGFLKNSGKPLPLMDTLILSLDKESIPRWNKFLQGYYDHSGISADSFDQAIRLNKKGEAELTDSMIKKGIRLQTTVSTSIFYIGFNMLDDVVGDPFRSSPGRVNAINHEASIRHKKLRQAISIAIDYEEYIQLFMNGRGIAAQGPLPPGIFGFQKNDINEAVYFWNGNHAERKPLSFAKKLLAEAGYPNGIDPKTGKALVLHYDVASTGNPDDKSQLNWMRKQFAKLGIDLNIRGTDYNRFQDKVRTGQAQIFSWGWLADYPDPENFLFLLYSANGKVKHGGENAANYSNAKADNLFDEIKDLPNGKKRLAKIREYLNIVQEEAPWIWGVHPIDFTLSHPWDDPAKPNSIANNSLKYQHVNSEMRHTLQNKWNKPILWPLFLWLGLMVIIFIPLCVTYWRRENKSTVKKID